jgi:hypothetical protein
MVDETLRRHTQADGITGRDSLPRPGTTVAPPRRLRRQLLRLAADGMAGGRHVFADARRGMTGAEQRYGNR